MDVVTEWVRRHIGRRGAFLGFLAVLDLAYGYSLFAASAPQRTINLLLPYWAWGWIWTGAGVVCLTGVVIRTDRIQYTVAATIKTAWALLYVYLWLVEGVPRSWVAVIIWLTFAFTVVVVSGWPEPPIIKEEEEPPKLPPEP